MMLSKEQESVKYLMRSRKRWSDFPNRSLPDNLCRLFWGVLSWMVIDFVAGLSLAMGVVGAFFTVMYKVTGMAIPKADVLSIPELAMFVLGFAVLTVAFGAVVVVTVAVLKAAIDEVIDRYARKTAKPRAVNVTAEYAKSLKQRWCPMIQYKEDLR